MKRLFSTLLALIIPVQAAVSQTADDAQARKARSVAQLRSEGVPSIDHLPTIEPESTSIRRNTEVVVQRAVALAIVAVKGETGDHAMGQALIRQFGAKGFFTPKEQAFMDDPDPSDQDQTNFTWRYEGVHVMLWALGIVPELERPDHICDVPFIANTLRELGTDGLMRGAKLRSQNELLDAADLTYRYDWAVVNARLKGEEPPTGLNKGVVHERHYALNWLIGYMDQDWDDISTDT
ncbi:DUF4272 domain-containing protein [Rhizobium bangladeshense]|uniref:DUF4272 domain-containing protein n=1 Tax=Rhizobium bangladeshense TaxID=1138189 RepID=A0ABS7LL17_9HYPH|nr:DUF4272 domain-containing protein [Rhizobium bangladeshense]MBX4867572.1 DUF4272 domain-containing protein [Rhizobium bangladeshense]MBX4871864.1 DUF4272 domain-containing protein [Rhizobium bangladeshense]MBX4883178.1 DUF4272 domain-containing protein [Rhizobium bangladeshense]MBY3592184.1 DUF4272 domain-containing protein [Rhizobium bangladeshense]